MSKLVDGIKDRMVAAACEAAPTVVDAAQKAATPRLLRCESCRWHDCR